MPKFNVGDRVVWRCETDPAVKATVAEVGDNRGLAETFDYGIVIDEEYITPMMQMLYAFDMAVSGNDFPSYEYAYEAELEALDE